jgi:hypothetical protein
VYCYGSFAEHAIEHIIQWNGNNGSIYFLQSEYPYGITTTTGDLPCLNVTSANFNGYGLGIYCNFEVGSPQITTAIKCPNDAQITNACTRFLSGSGSILKIINTEGNDVSGANRGPFYISKTGSTYQTCS